MKESYELKKLSPGKIQIVLRGVDLLNEEQDGALMSEAVTEAVKLLGEDQLPEYAEFMDRYNVDFKGVSDMENAYIYELVKKDV